MAGSDMDKTHHPPENKAAEPVDGVVPVAFVAGEQREQNVHRRKAEGCGGTDFMEREHGHFLSVSNGEFWK